MAVVIDSGPLLATDRLRYVPKDQWRDLLRLRARFVKGHITHDCRCLVQFVRDADEMFPALGFSSADDLIRNGLELVPAETRAAADWLQVNDPKTAMSLKAVNEAAERAQQLNKQTPDLKPAHRPKKCDNEKNNVTLSGRGNTPAYALARLRRDRPDIHQRVLAGEISPHAGMIAAGFRKKAERKKMTPLDKATSAVAKLTDDEWHELSQKENHRRGRLL
jgi:hypothetical protein